ncbi:MAG: hypothetical protein ACOC7U_04445 [Spirochaetota bacterium]
MKKLMLVVMVLVMASVPLASMAGGGGDEGEDEGGILGEWKGQFASPTYGLALFHGRLEDGWYGHPETIQDEEREMPATAMDLRIFRGVNVSRRGGFYTGVEAGLLFLAPFVQPAFYEPTLGEDMYFEYNGGLVFLMAKYGLRADIGISLVGISLGLELGMGETLFAGGFNLYTGSQDDRTGEVGWGSDAATMGLILDVAGEGAIRLGKNFRLIAKLGVMAAPLFTPGNTAREDYDVWYDSTNNVTMISPVWDQYAYAYDELIDTNPDNKDQSFIDKYGEWEAKRAILSRYNVEIEPWALDMRVGFALNF